MSLIFSLLIILTVELFSGTPILTMSELLSTSSIDEQYSISSSFAFSLVSDLEYPITFIPNPYFIILAARIAISPTPINPNVFCLNSIPFNSDGALSISLPSPINFPANEIFLVRLRVRPTISSATESAFWCGVEKT